MFLKEIGTMKIKLSCVIGLAAVLLGWSCREVYYPDEIYSDRKIPVIQGIILENEVPTVTLSWAIAYKDQVEENISGAYVYVTDNLGNSADLTESYAGTYTSYSSHFTGIRGRIYTLHVELPDGSEYVSNPVLLQENPSIDSLYAEPVVKTVYTYNDRNEPIEQEQQGLFVQADLSADKDSMLYYRFNTRVVKEMVYTVGMGTPGSYSIFLWDVYSLDNTYSVDYTITKNSSQVLREHQIGFMGYFYDASLETETSTAPFTVAWIMTFNVYSISADVYQYYNSIAEQLSSTDQVFAPVPSQVKSNVRCINDPGKLVIGIFEAASRTTIYKAFGWRSMWDYNCRDLESFPDIYYNGSSERFPPDFWIDF
jgi:hypothetical protein